MFASDRDLLVFEPALLRDVGWAGQRVLSATGSLSGSTLTIATGSFVDADVGAGSVVLFDGLVIEALARLSATQVTVSLMRSRSDGSALPPPGGTSRPVAVYSFKPQIEIVHRQVLAMVGLDADGEGLDGASAVTNPGALVQLEVFGALHLIYAAAGAPGRGGESMRERAEMYRARFGEERERVVAAIDMNGDGIADASRRPSVFAMTRG